jgi:hypothetical protein
MSQFIRSCAVISVLFMFSACSTTTTGPIVKDIQLKSGVKPGVVVERCNLDSVAPSNVLQLSHCEKTTLSFAQSVASPVPPLSDNSNNEYCTESKCKAHCEALPEKEQCGMRLKKKHCPMKSKSATTVLPDDEAHKVIDKTSEHIFD